MKWKLSSVTPWEKSPGFPPGGQVSNGHDMCYVHMLSREGMLENAGNYTHRISAVCPGCPAHLKNVQLRCKCSVRLSGAESTKQAVKWAWTLLRASPQQSPSQAAASSSVGTALLRDAVHSYQKVCFFFFCFKYQNYKNQFINCFSKTTTKTKQSPESKQNKILSKV